MPRAALLALVLLALGAPAARADVFAVTEGSAPQLRPDLDLIAVDVSTGQRLTLPAGINTTDDELHPAITPDGRRLVFERVNRADGKAQVILADLTTGQTAQLLVVAPMQWGTLPAPTITADGRTVLAGAPVDAAHATTVTQIDVRAFPAGPFPRTATAPVPGDIPFGGSEDPRVMDGRLLYTVDCTLPFGVPRDVIVDGRRIQDRQNRLSFSQPLVSGDTVIATVRDVDSASRTEGPGRIASLSPGVPLFQALPIDHDRAADDSRPALTADGRYLAFVRRLGSAAATLRLFDTLTQTEVGAVPSLGLADARLTGAVSLWVKPIFKLATVAPSGLITVDLGQATGVGILVQHVVGHHTVLGRRVPRLKPVGRVPLGRFARGRHHIRWDRRVGGRRLRPGTYRVTVRAVTPALRIRDLGPPRIVHIRHSDSVDAA